MARFMIVLLVLLIGTASLPCALAQSLSVPPNPEGKEVVQYPVRIGEDVLFTVHQRLKSFTPKERAEAIERRILAIAKDPFSNPASVTVSETDISTDIVAGDRILMSVFDQDAQPLGRTRQDLARDYAGKIRKGIEAYREKRSIKNLFVSVLLMLAATALLIGLMIFLKRISRRTEEKLGTMVDTKIGAVHIQSFEIVRAERVRKISLSLVRVIRLLVVIGALYAYLYLGLSLFPWTEPYAAALLNYVLGPLNTLGEAASRHVPGLFFIAVVVVVTRYVLRLLHLFFNEIEKGAVTLQGFYPEWAQPTFRICRWLIIAFAAVVAFPYIPGSDSPAFKGISIFVGILFSLGSSSAIANLVAGLTLTYRRAFKVGDRVKIAEVIGDVVSMRLQVTHLRTVKNEEVTIPNSTIINNPVINYSSLARDRGLILHTTVTIGYDTPWRQVHALLILAAERTPGLLREPPPFVLQTSLDDFYVSYELNAYTREPQEMATLYSTLHKNIQDAFNEYGVQIMSPSYRLDPERPKVVPKERWYEAPANPSDDPEKEE